MPTILPPKKDVALALLERASVFIHLDPRDPSVQVPSWFKRQAQLVLQVGLNMLVRIPDLEVGDEAIACTLSFNRAPHYCYVPWRAVYALVGEDGRGMVWPEDIPPEVPAHGHALPQRPRLHSVPRDGEAPSSAKSPSLFPGPLPSPARVPSPASVPPPASAVPGSRRGRFRAVAERDSSDAPSARGDAFGSPSTRPHSSKANESIKPPSSEGARRDAISPAEGPPVLSLSGSRRRRANAGSRLDAAGAASGAGVSTPPSSDELPPSLRDPADAKSSSESSDTQRAPSSSESQERSSRSSERPYLRLVR